MSDDFLCFRVSRLRWLVSTMRLRSGGLDAYCKFLLRLCRLPSLTESRSVASHAPVSHHLHFGTCANRSAFLCTGNNLRQDLLPSFCWKCHWIQVRKSLTLTLTSRDTVVKLLQDLKTNVDFQHYHKGKSLNPVYWSVITSESALLFLNWLTCHKLSHKVWMCSIIKDS